MKAAVIFLALVSIISALSSVSGACKLIKIRSLWSSPHASSALMKYTKCTSESQLQEDKGQFLVIESKRLLSNLPLPIIDDFFGGNSNFRFVASHVYSSKTRTDALRHKTIFQVVHECKNNSYVPPELLASVLGNYIELLLQIEAIYHIVFPDHGQSSDISNICLTEPSKGQFTLQPVPTSISAVPLVEKYFIHVRSPLDLSINSLESSHFHILAHVKKVAELLIDPEERLQFYPFQMCSLISFRICFSNETIINILNIIYASSLPSVSSIASMAQKLKDYNHQGGTNLLSPSSAKAANDLSSTARQRRRETFRQSQQKVLLSKYKVPKLFDSQLQKEMAKIIIFKKAQSKSNSSFRSGRSSVSTAEQDKLNESQSPRDSFSSIEDYSVSLESPTSTSSHSLWQENNISLQKEKIDESQSLVSIFSTEKNNGNIRRLCQIINNTLNPYLEEQLKDPYAMKGISESLVALTFVCRSNSTGVINYFITKSKSKTTLKNALIQLSNYLVNTSLYLRQRININHRVLMLLLFKIIMNTINTPLTVWGGIFPELHSGVSFPKMNMHSCNEKEKSTPENRIFSFLSALKSLMCSTRKTMRLHFKTVKLRELYPIRESELRHYIMLLIQPAADPKYLLGHQLTEVEPLLVKIKEIMEEREPANSALIWDFPYSILAHNKKIHSTATDYTALMTLVEKVGVEVDGSLMSFTLPFLKDRIAYNSETFIMDAMYELTSKIASFFSDLFDIDSAYAKQLQMSTVRPTADFISYCIAGDMMDLVESSVPRKQEQGGSDSDDAQLPTEWLLNPNTCNLMVNEYQDQNAAVAKCLKYQKLLFSYYANQEEFQITELLTDKLMIESWLKQLEVAIPQWLNS